MPNNLCTRVAVSQETAERVWLVVTYARNNTLRFGYRRSHIHTYDDINSTELYIHGSVRVIILCVKYMRIYIIYSQLKRKSYTTTF